MLGRVSYDFDGDGVMLWITLAQLIGAWANFHCLPDLSLTKVAQNRGCDSVQCFLFQRTRLLRLALPPSQVSPGPMSAWLSEVWSSGPARSMTPMVTNGITLGCTPTGVPPIPACCTLQASHRCTSAPTGVSPLLQMEGAWRPVSLSPQLTVSSCRAEVSLFATENFTEIMHLNYVTMTIHSDLCFVSWSVASTSS